MLLRIELGGKVTTMYTQVSKVNGGERGADFRFT